MVLAFTDKSILVGVIRQQTYTWANFDPDLCRYMNSLGHNKLKRVYKNVHNVLELHNSRWL